jgi:hypothetical protein
VTSPTRPLGATETGDDPLCSRIGYPGENGDARGYAALITIYWANRDVMWTIFEEEAGRPDPLLCAQALGRSVAADWPNHEQKVIGNERAGELQARRLLGSLYADDAR